MSQALRLPARWTFAQLMVVIAAIAIPCRWPICWLLAVPLSIGLIGQRLKASIAEYLTIIGIIGLLTALLLPAIIGSTPARHSRRHLVNLALGSTSTGVLPGKITRLSRDGKEKSRPIWSPDGIHLTFARHESGSTHIWQYVMKADDPQSAKRLTDRKAPDFHAAYLPDGKRLVIATVSLSGTQGNVDVELIGDDGKGLKKLVGDISGKLSHQDWPSPSPDGSRFAFSSTHEGNQEIYACKIDGTDVVRLTQSPGHDAHPSWSPQNDVIAFATDRWNGLEIAAVKPDGTGLVRLTKSPGIDDFPAFSPDGSRIAFVSHRDGNAEIYVMNADGSNPINLTNHPGRDTQPGWKPDGSGITFVSDRDGGTDLYTIEVTPN